MFGLPCTFTRRGVHVVTILTKAHAATLPEKVAAFCALSIARNSKTHAEACESIIAAGLATDHAEADALIYTGERTEGEI